MIRIKPSLYLPVINVVFVIILFLLPYYLFGGRLFLGGDDTRLYYAYPEKLLESLNLYSWNNVSSLPSYLPNHHTIPLLVVASILGTIIKSRVHLFYFFYSLPQVIGFIYFQKFIRELIGKEYIISITSALVYILSPIALVSLSYFLTPVWVLALFPVVLYYYLCFIQRGQIKDLVKITVWSVFLSIAYFPLPWVAGLAMPLLVGLIFLFLFIKNPPRIKVKRTVLFASFIISSQLFWIVPFVASLANRSSGLGERIASKALADSFTPTVMGTATGNIIYPLLTLYHRQITIDYNLQLKNVYLSYYDSVLPISAVFVVVIILGILKFGKTLDKSKRNLYIVTFVSFMASLFFFTVNIGLLKYVFIFLGAIPGFVVFRNFTDKFALGYIFIFATFLSLSLLVLKKSSRFFVILLLITLFAVLVNFIPVKKIISSPLWTTKNIYPTVKFPQEYLSFEEKISHSLTKTNNIIEFPQNIGAYSVIVEDNGKNAYVGVSPFKFFTGINDLGGGFSYPPAIGDKIRNSIEERNYTELLRTLERINTGYAIVTNNIPEELTKSYLFDDKYLKFQDKRLISEISERKLIVSDKGNYVLYKLRNSPAIISSHADIHFKKVNPVKYVINIKNLKDKQKLLFLETFHPGWKLFASKVNSRNLILDNVLDILYIFKSPVFDKSHIEAPIYGNQWVVDPALIKNGNDEIELTLYFFPQIYFYIGVGLSIICLSFLTFFTHKNEINK